MSSPIVSEWLAPKQATACLSCTPNELFRLVADARLRVRRLPTGALVVSASDIANLTASLKAGGVIRDNFNTQENNMQKICCASGDHNSQVQSRGVADSHVHHESEKANKTRVSRRIASKYMPPDFSFDGAIIVDFRHTVESSITRRVSDGVTKLRFWGRTTMALEIQQSFPLAVAG